MISAPGPVTSRLPDRERRRRRRRAAAAVALHRGQLTPPAARPGNQPAGRARAVTERAGGAPDGSSLR
ncbi:hypothetical protein [Kineococcus terrestris]|uniref:hypothetical protein n=1 Tax=Kineococcus terrestris TaxID=2044856 RepID=UPI0034DB02DC